MFWLPAINIISGLFVFAFGLYVWFLNKKSSLNKIYFIFSIFILFLAFAFYNFCISNNLDNVKQWYKFLLLWPFIVSLSFHLILIFVKNKIKPFWEIILYFVSLCFTLYQLFILKDYVQFKKINNIWFYYPVHHFSFLNIAFISWATILQILSLYYLVKFYYTIDSKKYKKMTIIIIIGVFIPFFYGFIKGVILGIVGFPLIDLNVPLYAISTIVLGYGIMKYDLFKRVLKDKLIDSFNTSNIILVIVKDGRVDFINNFTKKILKINRDDIFKLKIFDFINKEDFQKVVKEIEKVNGNENSKPIETKLFDINKNEHFVLFNVTKLYDEFNGNVYYILIGNDITYQKKIENNLIKAKELAEISDISKQNFLHNLHHEFKTPLTSIIGFSDFLINMVKNEEIVKELKIINNAGKVLYEYFENLIEITNLDFKEYKEDIFYMRNLIKSITKTYNFLARSKNIKFKIETKGNMNKLLIGDFLKTKQVIGMVLNNSFKFISKNPEVKLIIEEMGYGIDFIDNEYMENKYMENKYGRMDNELNKRKKFRFCILGKQDITFNKENCEKYFKRLKDKYFYRVVIIDNGIGIDVKKINKIGQIFELGENVLNKNFRGIGLGLYIVNRILQIIDGKFFVKSILGKGTEVELIIPFEDKLGRKMELS